jgi:hypothetical protein
MRHITAIALQLAAVLAPTAASLAGPLRISTGTLTEDHAAAVLEFEIRGAPASRRIELTQLPAGESAPCQTTMTPLGAKLTWLAPSLKKGQEGLWEVDLVSTDAPAPKARVITRRDGNDVVVLADGVELTRLVGDPAGPKPYLFPLRGPNGKMITRQFPMKAKVAGEDQDHPHHRSLWFTHGEVGGVDFWAEGPKRGVIRQTRIEALESGPVYARIDARSEWQAPDGKKVLQDRTVYTFYPLERGQTLIDIAITLEPAGNDPVVFGDTKEGSFGIRLAESMKEKNGGTIVNSRGQRGMKEAWGKPAEWVDYFGKVEGDIVGVAILDHPTSFRHPTHWHVRDYGLFAANPFGYRDFYGDKSKDGSHKLEKGMAMEFRYRVYLHHGDAEAAQVAAVYRSFATPPALKPKQE